MKILSALPIIFLGAAVLAISTSASATRLQRAEAAAGATSDGFAFIRDKPSVVTERHTAKDPEDTNKEYKTTLKGKKIIKHKVKKITGS